jgi:phage shock protein PspC (stress-responsive transcriptional regulator)
MVGGVAGGMAQYMGVEPAWIRIAWLALLVLGPGIILYVIAWIGVPEADTGTETVAVRPVADRDTGRFIFGGLLVIAGAAMLARQYLPWMQDLIMPAVLIAIGIGVITYSVKK